MDALRAKERLAMLADEFNPMTGEPLARDDICNQPEIICALYVTVRQLEQR